MIYLLQKTPPALFQDAGISVFFKKWGSTNPITLDSEKQIHPLR